MGDAPAHRDFLSRRKKRKSNDGSFLIDEGERAGLEEKRGAGEDDGPGDDWDGYLNWATGDNPDGVPVVHESMDQGLCGSCWVSRRECTVYFK